MLKEYWPKVEIIVVDWLCQYVAGITTFYFNIKNQTFSVGVTDSYWQKLKIKTTFSQT